MPMGSNPDEARDVQGRFARRPAGGGLARPGDGPLCDRHRGTLQQALDDWGFIAPQLQDLYET
jgi:hypothetical protein